MKMMMTDWTSPPHSPVNAQDNMTKRHSGPRMPFYGYIFIHLSTVSSIWIRTHAAAKPICFLGRMLQQSSGRRVDLHRRPFPWECNDCRNPTSSYIVFLNVGFGIPFPAAALVAQTYTLRLACNCDQHVQTLQSGSLFRDVAAMYSNF